MVNALKETQKKSHIHGSKGILLYLARYGERNKWQIARDLEKAYSNIHAAMRRLVAKDFIYISSRKAGKKNNQFKVKYYKLALAGFFTVLLFNKRSWEYIDEIAQQQANWLPLIFGKWSFYSKKGLKDEVTRRLRIALLKVSDPVKNALDSLESIRKEMGLTNYEKIEKAEDFMTNKLGHERIKEQRKAQLDILESGMNFPRDRINNLFIFGVPNMQTTEKQMKFMSILRDDHDLRQYVTEQFGKQEKEYTTHVENLKSWRVWWESLEEKPS